MPDIHIHRDHTLGLAEARKVAFRWAEQAEAEFGMECTYEEGKMKTTGGVHPLWRSRAMMLKGDQGGVRLDAKLGFLLGAFEATRSKPRSSRTWRCCWRPNGWPQARGEEEMSDPAPAGVPTGPGRWRA